MSLKVAFRESYVCCMYKGTVTTSGSKLHNL